MREIYCEIIANEKIAKDIHRMVLACDTSEISAPGQFVGLRIGDNYLRRPISISDWSESELTLIYKVVGKGTYELTEMTQGDHVPALLPLGNGYRLEDIPEGAVLVGGGVGVPPLYGLAKALQQEGKSPKVRLGFNTLEEAFLVNEFHELGVDTEVKIGGLITEILSPCDYLCACGPMPMLRALAEYAPKGQFSLEARMGCGFGACMGCSVETTEGPVRICSEGPVLDKEVLVW